jgi:RsiW-degrading membrane proteinase PrsW (M82 family)
MHWLAWTVLVALYVAICLFAIYMTHREHRHNGQRSLVLSGLSFVLCLVWPLLVPAMLVFARLRPAEFAPVDARD